MSITAPDRISLASQPVRGQVATLEVSELRADFPLLCSTINGKPLIYLDNGATTQKPKQVIDAIETYYRLQNANIHRGVYQLSQLSTDLYEQARSTVAEFLNVADTKEIIFTRGTTEGINLVASSWGRANLANGDEVIVSTMEHHANIVPWQMACAAAGAVLRVIPINDAGELRLDVYRQLLNERTKMVAVTHLSNSLGTINDVSLITQLAHDAGATVLIDGAQWVGHHATDVQAIGCDFYVFSGHKLFGPTGIGVLYGKRSLLEAMPPYQGGGDMIESVTFEKTTYAGLPNKFEAGTPNIAGAIGLAAAIKYVQGIGFDAIGEHESRLLAYATDQLQTVPGLRLVGTAANKGSVLSFVLENPPVSSLDIGVGLDRLGIAIRTGHHCCQPVMARMDISSTARASLAMYTTADEIDALVDGLKRIVANAANRPATAPSDAKISYPSATADSVTAAAEAIADDLSLFEDRDSKSQFVIDTGEQLPHTFDLLKKVTPRVTGCMSEVYLVAHKAPADPARMQFVGDSDAAVVRGLIALTQRLFSGQRAADILAFNVDSFFHRIGLDQFITSQRRNGLAGMVSRLRHEAEKIVGEGARSHTKASGKESSTNGHE